MTREEVAIKLAKDSAFKQLVPERQRVVFEEAARQALDQPGAEGQHFGLTGSIPESAYQAGERNIAGNVFERPAAATRGFIQGLAPGGPTPIENYVRGSVNPAAIPSFQQVALDAYYGQNRTTAPNVAEMVGGLGPSAVGLAADVVTNPAEVLTAILPKAPGIRQGLQAVGQTRPARAVGEFLTKERAGPGFLQEKFPQGLTLTEDQLAKMPPPRRARYLEVQQMRAEQSVGRQIGHFEEQARLREAQVQARADVGATAVKQQQVRGRVEAEAIRENVLRNLSVEEQSQIAQLDTQRQGVESLLHDVAKQKTLVARQPFFDAAHAHSTEYGRLIQQEVATPQAQQARVTVKELDDMVAKLFEHDLESERLAHNTLSLLDDPLRAQHPFAPQEVLSEIDALSLQRGGYNKLRVYTDRERIADDLRTGLLDLLESKGVDFKTAKSYWAPWANVRNKAIRVLRPFEDPRFPSYTGARALEQVAKGMGPQEVVKEIERELGVNLTDDLRGVVSQLQANDRAKLLGKVHFESLREEAAFAATRRIADLGAQTEAATARLQAVTGRKLAGIRTEAQAQATLARAASGRKLTRIEQLQRQVIEQAEKQTRMKRVMKRALYAVVAYGGAKQVPVLKDILP